MADAANQASSAVSAVSMPLHGALVAAKKDWPPALAAADATAASMASAPNRTNVPGVGVRFCNAVNEIMLTALKS